MQWRIAFEKGPHALILADERRDGRAIEKTEFDKEAGASLVTANGVNLRNMEEAELCIPACVPNARQTISALPTLSRWTLRTEPYMSRGTIAHALEGASITRYSSG